MPSEMTFPDWIQDGLEPVGAVQASVCRWTPVCEGFDSECGQAWQWHDHGWPGQHPWNHCACCGRQVQIVDAPESQELGEEIDVFF